MTAQNSTTVAGSVADSIYRPTPRVGERPAMFADRVGEWYVDRQTELRRKKHGLYLTPVPIADHMARLLTMQREHLRILDPAAGAGLLCCAAVEALARRRTKPRRIELVAYETDSGLTALLEAVLAYLSRWATAQDVTVTFRIRARDFIDSHSRMLATNTELWTRDRSDAVFDAVIANPPYFKIGRADPRALANAEVVHGQPNIYALFMAIGGALLRQGGVLVFITPRSFASGPYFRKFRTRFFGMIQPRHVHIFGSRRAAFQRDDVLQENVIFVGVRNEDWWLSSEEKTLAISCSSGVHDIKQAPVRTVSIAVALDMRSTDKLLRLPASERDDDAIDLIESWPNTLRGLELRISTGPIVPFRATEHVDTSGEVPTTHVPLLWMHHVRPLQVTWPMARTKPQFVRLEDSGVLLVANKNYVLLRRFSAKEEARRLIAAPYLAKDFQMPAVGLENHLNYIHRPSGDLTDDEAWGLAALYSTRLLDTYFRVINGNTQVSATELRAMPLPAHEVLVALGRYAKEARDPIGTVDQHLLQLVSADLPAENVVGLD